MTLPSNFIKMNKTEAAEVFETLLEIKAKLDDLDGRLNKIDKELDQMSSYVYSYEREGLVSKVELQRKLNASFRSVDQLIESGDLHPVRVSNKPGGKIYFLKREVDKLFESIALSAGLSVRTP